LGDEPGTATLAAAADLPEVTVSLPPFSCPLLVRDLPLARFGLPGTLRLASADLVGAGPEGIALAARTTSAVALADEDAPPALVELEAPLPGSPVRATVRSGRAEWNLLVRHPEDVDAPPEAPFEAGEPAVLTGARRLGLATRSGRTSTHRTPPVSEALGVHRGRLHCAASIEGVEELLIEGAGDIVDLALDGRALPSRAPFGVPFLVRTSGAARLEATVETWGHSNFDDARLPALALGSLRGPGRVWSVTAREDVGALWTVEGDEQWAGDPAPTRVLGGW